MRKYFHTKRRVIVALLFCCTLFCCVSKKKEIVKSCPEGFEKVTVINQTGLDGCGYMLMRKDSSHFEVNNLADSLKIDGKVICIKYHVAKIQTSVCMAGQRIDILEVR